MTIGLIIGCRRGQENEGRSNQPPDAVVRSTQTAPAVTSEESWLAVERTTLRVHTPAVGTFRARQTTQLGPQVGGRVLSVLVDVGDVVKKDQELVRIDPTFFEIEVKQREAGVAAAKTRLALTEQTIKTAQANVEMSRATLAEAQLDYSRMKSLWEKPGGESPSISRQRYDSALFRLQETQAQLEAAESRSAETQAKVKEAQVQVQEAEQALDYARQRLAETAIRAPYDAVVTRRMVDSGEPASANPVTYLLEVREVGVLYLEFALPQEMLPKVHPGTPVEFDAEGVEDEAVAGQVSVVFPAIDEATRSFRCRVVVENQDRRFRPGLLGAVRVVEREVADALVVQRRALRQTATGWEVIVTNEGQPVPRPVELGLLTEDLAQVVRGLSEGDRVLVPKADGP